MLEILMPIVSHPVYLVASTVSLILVTGAILALVALNLKEHLTISWD